MEVNARVYQRVEIDPKDVINSLFDQETKGGYVIKEFGKFFRVFEEYGGHKGIEVSEEITKEKYEYIIALQLVINNLNKK